MSMSRRPYIMAGDWIDIGPAACVISAVREEGHKSGDCEVVFNALRPTRQDVEWDGNEWRFPARGQSHRAARRSPRAAACVPPPPARRASPPLSSLGP